MKQKRILALLLALTAAFCLTGAANAEEETPVVREGTIVEVMEDGFLLQEADGREILYNVDEQTVLDGIASLTDLQKDLYVIVESDGRLTKSIPPQAHADRVTCYWLAGQVESVDEEENTFLMQTELGTVIVHRGELTTPVYAEMNVTVYFDGVMALSEPGQIAARKIEVPEVQGTVLEMTENGFVLRTDDETEYRVILTEETVRGVLLPLRNRLTKKRLKRKRKKPLKRTFRRTKRKTLTQLKPKRPLTRSRKLPSMSLPQTPPRATGSRFISAANTPMRTAAN